MKSLIRNILVIIALSILILISYAWLEGRLSALSPGEIITFFKQNKKERPSAKRSEHETYRAVWLSYLEFAAYTRSVEQNDEKHFRKFYQHIMDQCKKMHMTHIIVQVRPFGDALYKSDYYPWAGCISGQQGVSPGYDPLKIMVELTHKNHMKLEAWINPYRVSSGDDIEALSKDNPARIWSQNPDAARRVLTYEGAMYYNPASKKARELIINGAGEIVSHYDVDGIHMDDYFYPEFSADNVKQAFDAKEYKQGIKNGKISQNMSIGEWRRYNVNLLVKGIYQKVKDIKLSATFGISPSGNLTNLRSDLSCYADIDTWISNEGYIDYIMPQIYWGYSNTEAPFEQMLKEWKELCCDSDVGLYTGLQLYRIGSDDQNVSDYKELQSADGIKKQIKQVVKDPDVAGYCLFSYQDLDVEDETWHFDSEEFSKKRKKLLKEVAAFLT